MEKLSNNLTYKNNFIEIQSSNTKHSMLCISNFIYISNIMSVYFHKNNQIILKENPADL